MLGYYVVKLFSKILCLLPFCVAKAVGNLLGAIAGKFVPGWRMEMAKANVRECLGVDDARAEQIVRDSVKRFGRMGVEVLRFPLLNEKTIHDVVKVEGLEHLEKAYQEGRGVIMATGHFGNWELLGATVALNGYPMLSVARKQNNGHMDTFINEYRQMVGQKVSYNHGSSSILSIARMLKEKNLLGILYDQDTGDSKCVVNFFGKQSRFPLGAATLSRVYGSPILPIFMHNNADGTCTAKIYPPLYTPKTKDRDADCLQTTKELATVLEQEIISDPSMWFWVHDRWKDGRKRFRKK